jgi:hypothetical protein
MSDICICGHHKTTHTNQSACTVAGCRCLRFSARPEDDTPSSADTITLPASALASSDNDEPDLTPDTPDFQGGGGDSGGGDVDSTF